MEYQLILFPNELLLQECAKVEKITKSTKEQAQAMFQIMYDNNGIGLAAPLVGVLNKLIVIDTLKLDPVNGFKGVIINPIIMKKSNVRREYTEGCLSFPGKLIKIRRPTEVTLKYKNISGKVQYTIFKGITATVVFHEFAHLQGKLFTEFERQ